MKLILKSTVILGLFLSPFAQGASINKLNRHLMDASGFSLTNTGSVVLAAPAALIPNRAPDTYRVSATDLPQSNVMIDKAKSDTYPSHISNLWYNSGLDMYFMHARIDKSGDVHAFTLCSGPLSKCTSVNRGLCNKLLKAAGAQRFQELRDKIDFCNNLPNMDDLDPDTKKSLKQEGEDTAEIYSRQILNLKTDDNTSALRRRAVRNRQDTLPDNKKDADAAMRYRTIAEACTVFDDGEIKGEKSAAQEAVRKANTGSK
ncbi:hypothetical protein [Bdellovibrio sp. HCB337]|uniref:hypothetical protein n=1 Tax=Bdellovibrio sp. HCB337 TaxID=3394358 RepID=UPI0039A5CDC7